MQSPSGQGPVWPGYTDSNLPLIQPDLAAQIAGYIDQHQLGSSFTERLQPLYLPMAQWIAAKHIHGQTLFIGINGAQGSGKSTLAGLLSIILTTGFGKRTISISIDDFYHDLDTRKEMARDIHPLFITRGVPGTHDVDLGLKVFQQLRDHTEGHILMPQFDKAIDDRLPEAEWKSCDLPVDIVLFEGWCVGARAQSTEALLQPVNTLESQEDPDASWRNTANHFLADKYQAWFQFLDYLLMLAVPSMEQVYEWRGLQESKLENSTRHPAPSGVMNKEKLLRFIMHYERLTRSQLEEMPGYADVYMPLDKEHQIADVIIRQGT